MEEYFPDTDSVNRIFFGDVFFKNIVGIFNLEQQQMGMALSYKAIGNVRVCPTGDCDASPEPPYPDLDPYDGHDGGGGDDSGGDDGDGGDVTPSGGGSEDSTSEDLLWMWIAISAFALIVIILVIFLVLRSRK